MVLRKKADQNMGQYAMTRLEARTLIEKARAGKPVHLLDLKRATLTWYRGNEPRKLFFPAMHAAERMRVNAVLLWNIGQARYRQLLEKLDAERTAAQDEPGEVRGSDEGPDRG